MIVNKKIVQVPYGCWETNIQICRLLNPYLKNWPYDHWQYLYVAMWLVGTEKRGAFFLVNEILIWKLLKEKEMSTEKAYNSSALHGGLLIHNFEGKWKFFLKNLYKNNFPMKLITWGPYEHAFLHKKFMS